MHVFQCCKSLYSQLKITWTLRVPSMSVKRNQVVVGLFAGLMLCVIQSVSADARYDGERTYWGLGASLNRTDYLSRDIMRDLFNEAFFSNSSANSYEGVIRHFDDVDDGFKFFWGYSVNKLWDWEVGYVDLGAAFATFEANNIDGPWLAAELEANSWNRGFFGHVQYSPDLSDNFEFMIRVGVLRWDARRESIFRTRQPDGESFKKQETKGSYDEFFGAGFAWHINDQYVLRCDVDRYHLGEAETEVVSLSAIAYF